MLGIFSAALFALPSQAAHNHPPKRSPTPPATAAKAVNGAEPLKVVAYDYGIKLNILRRLTSFGCKVTVVPADYPAEKVGGGGQCARNVVPD